MIERRANELRRWGFDRSRGFYDGTTHTIEDLAPSIDAVMTEAWSSTSGAEGTVHSGFTLIELRGQ